MMKKSPILLYQHKIEHFIKNKANYEENWNFVFGILWKQSSNPMWEKIRSDSVWDTKLKKNVYNIKKII